MGKSAALSMWREPLLLIAYGLSALHVAWFLVNLATPWGPPALGNAPLAAGLVVAVVAYWRAAVTPGLPAAARRFWRTMTLAAVVLAGAVIGQLPGLDRGSVPRLGPAGIAALLLGVGLLLLALYRLPLGVAGRAERIRLVLDLATVTVGGLLVAWYFWFARMSGSPDARLMVVTIALTVLLCLVLLGIAKVALSGSRTVDALALRLLGVGVLVEVAALLANPLVGDHPRVAADTIGRAVATVLWVAAGVAQARTGRGEAGPRRRRSGRRFSALPYAAVAAVDALLLASTVRHGDAEAVVGIGVVALTGLVIIRQLVAFKENSRLLDELARQELRFRSLVQYANDAIAIRDSAGAVIYVSPGIERLTGRPAASWIGYTGADQIHPDDLPAVEDGLARAAASPGEPQSLRVRIAHADGGWRLADVTATDLLADPAVAGLVVNLTDVTELEEYHQQLSHQASHDALTDLANRTLFGEQLELALARSAELYPGYGQSGHLSLALIDLDDFKLVNDSLGHQAGDQLLIEVAERLRRGVRPQDLVARLGGDEFAVLLEGAGPDHVDGIAERVLAILAEPVTVAGRQLCVQASVGIADAGPGLDSAQLMSRADLAMYAAKDAGKGRYARYAADMAPRTSPRAQIIAELHRALERQELELFYQPIVRLPQGDGWEGVEVLLRWRHPEQGIVAPMQFIPVAEETGLIMPIGRWVLRTACRQAALWLEQFPEQAPATVNVNVSARQLRDPDFLGDVTAALADAGLAPDRLVIEITESAIVDHAPAAASLRALRGLGVRVSLDDFGTGYSSLSLLDALPVDQLKLDRSLLGAPGRDAVAAAVMRIAETIGAGVVAEGIEGTHQAERLHALGYPLAQGFLFARPEPAESITERLAAAADVGRDIVAG